MVDGSKFPDLDSGKVFIIAVAVILALIVGLTVFIGSNENSGKQAAISVEEAAKAKEKGMGSFKKGEWDAAIEEFKKAVAGNPKDLHAQFQLAYAYEQKGLLDAAYKQYDEILKVSKESADAHYNKGRILVQKKELDKAIAEFETAAKLNANFTSVRADLASAYVAKKEFEKALGTYAELENIIKHDNHYLSRIYVAKGNIYKQMGQIANAKAMFTKALELDKNNKEAEQAIAGLK